MGKPNDAIADLASVRACVALGVGATVPETRGVQVNVDGDYSLRFAEGAANVTLTLQKGVIYDYAVVRVDTANVFGLY